MEEAKIGVFLSDCGKQLAEILNFEEIADHLKGVPQVSLVAIGNEFWRGQGLKKSS